MDDETLVMFGEAVKSLGDGRVGGYLVRFTTDNDPDLTGEFFTSETDFDLDLPGKSTTYFNHGIDVKLGKRKFTKAALKQDEFGIWAETILKERDDYEKFLLELANEGKLGWSSGTAGHLVETETAGKAIRITRWPLGLDASLTHIPAEPRNTAVPLKSLLPQIPEQPIGEAEAVGDTAQSDGLPGEAAKSENIKTEITIMEITEERINEMIATASKAAADEAVKSVVASLPPTNGGGNNVVVVDDEADRALKINPFKSFGEQLVAVVKEATGEGMDTRLKALKQLGLNEGLPSEGGFLVQQDQSGELLRNAYEGGVLASRVRRIPVSANANGLRINAIAEASRVTGSRWGGIQSYWLGEGGTKLPTHPLFRQIQLDLKKLIGLCYATDELLQDATALESVISQAFSEEFAWMLDEAILNGTGVGQPLGILNSPALVTQAPEAGQLVDTVVAENIINMYSRMPGRNRSNAIWVYNQDIEPQLFTMGLTVGLGGVAVFMPPGGLSAAPYGQLMGRPALPMEQADNLGDVGDINFIDPSQYITIDKGGMQTASSIHVAFLTDENVFRFVYRFDGQPAWVAPLTPANGVTQLSPFVTLAAR